MGQCNKSPVCSNDGIETVLEGGQSTDNPHPTVRAVSNSTTGYSIFVPTSVNNFDLPAVVDTAAQVSVMSRHTYLKLGLQQPTHLTATTIRTAESGSLMKCFVLPDVCFTINGDDYHHSVIVGNFEDKLILGLDFLIKFKCTINIPGSSMSIGHKQMPVWIRKNNLDSENYFISQVFCKEDCHVPPYSKILVPVVVTAPPGTLMTTTPVSSNSLLIPSVLLTVQIDNHIEVLNDTGNAVKIQIDDMLAEAIESDEPVVRQVNVNSHVSNDLPPEGDPRIGVLLTQYESKLPEHVRGMYQESAPRLNSWGRLGVCFLLSRYSDVFSTTRNDLGRFSEIQHRIETLDEIPTREKLRRTPLKFQHEEEKTLNDMLDAGVIVPSTSDWASAPVLVRKKSGEVRYTVDFRKLNAKTRKDAYPLPLINECTDMLSGSVWFHTLDLNAGYWQIEIDPRDRHKSAFLTKYGLYEHVRMAQGLCNAPATFQRVMNLVLRGMIWNQVLVYLDDVIVLGRDQRSGLDNLHEVLERLRQHSLKLKAKKCTLFGTEVTFLGRKVSKDGVAVTNDNIQSVIDWPRPHNALELSKFLGFINYHRDFIPGLAGIAKSLYPLTKQKSVFNWSDDCEVAFTKLKQVITTTPVLSFPNSHDKFTLDTDASDSAIGAALYQEQMGKLRPIAFTSVTLTPEQRRYCTTRKELLAIVMFTRHFRHYLLGQEFIVRTDHSSLAWLFRFREIHGQLGRWLEELSQYHMTIQHRSGDRHSNADGMSRIPPSTPECDCYVAGRELSSLPCGGCIYCKRLHTQWSKFETEVDYVIPLAVRGLDANISDSPLIEGYTPRELKGMQADDPELHVLVKWIESGSAPSDAELMLQGHCTKSLWRNKSLLLLREGVLYYRWVDSDTAKTPKLIVPYKMREKVLQMYHDHRIGGHWGIKKTMSNMSRSFYWPTMRRDTDLYVKTCGTCQRNKPRPKLRTGLQHYQAGLPGERVHIDFLGPFPVSESGNRFVMVMVDQFTKWVELAPLPDQTAATTANSFFEQWVSRFGTPIYVHTDQGSNFTSDLFLELCRLLQVVKTRTTPYRPSSNGQVERINRSILSFVRCFLEDNARGWDKYLPALGMSLRATLNRSTGFTPNLLRLGQEVHLPAELMFQMTQFKDSSTDQCSYVQRLLSRLNLAFTETRSSLHTSHLVQKKDYDLRSPLRTKRFDLGDIVYLTNNCTRVGECKKLQPLLKGPYVVKSVVSETLYVIANQKGEKVHHHDRLVLCEDRAIPLWVHRLRECVLGGEPYAIDLDDSEIGDFDWLFPTELDPIDTEIDKEVVEFVDPDILVTNDEVEVAPTRFTRRGREVKIPSRYLD